MVIMLGISSNNTDVAIKYLGGTITLMASMNDMEYYTKNYMVYPLDFLKS